MCENDTGVAGQMRILSKEGAAACALFDLSTDPAAAFDLDDYLETYQKLEARTLVEALRLYFDTIEAHAAEDRKKEKRRIVSIELTMNARVSVAADDENEAVEKATAAWETDEEFVETILRSAALTDFSICESYAEADGSEIELSCK